MFAALLVSRGIQFVAEKKIIVPPKRIFYLDFWLYESRMAVEVDGFHHLKAEKKIADQERTDLIRAACPWVGPVWRVLNSEVRVGVGNLWVDRILTVALRRQMMKLEDALLMDCPDIEELDERHLRGAVED